jgi:hypothetical protein
MKMPFLKRILPFIQICLLSFYFNKSHAQFLLDSLYQDPNTYLIFSEVFEFDSIPTQESIKRIKNWSGTQFVNPKEVMVGETENQLVFNYITSKFYFNGIVKIPLDWYIRLIIQIKQNKIRLMFFDDGNAYRPPVYTGNGMGVPAVPARIDKLSAYIKKGKSTKAMEKPFRELIASIHDYCNSIKFSFKNQENPLKEDW